MSQAITIDDLTAYMPTTALDAGTAQIVVDGANSWLETQTGRCFGEIKQVTERYDWQGTVWLRHMDVVSIDEVTLGFPGQTSTTLDASGYYLNPLGRLTILGSSNRTHPRYPDLLSVQYTYGFTKLGYADEQETMPLVPDDLKQALLGIAAGFYGWATNGQKDVAAVSVGSYHVEYTNKRAGAGGSDDATSTSDANWAVIQSYRLRQG